MKLGWGHDFTDSKRLVFANLSAAPTTVFTATGADPDTERAIIAMGFALKLDPKTSLYAHYDGQINGHDDSHAVIGGLRYTW
ncbi:MAG: autotransporter outer membrane beta-barrel domain-containing protein [Pseudomonadota bacterium]